MKFKIKKIISLIMVLILLLGVLTGCGEKDSQELSERKRRQIEAKWLETYGKTLVWWDFENGNYDGARYYGKFGGYHVIFTEEISIAANEGFLLFGDIEFRHPKNFNIYFYKNGKFYTFKEVYKYKLVSEEDMQELFNIHWHKYEKQVHPQYYERMDPMMNVEMPTAYVPPVDKEYLKEVETRWHEEFGYEIKWRDIANKQYDGAGYYGTFYDYFIIFETTETIEGATDTLIIHNYKFLYPEKFVFLLYKDGEFYSLKELYWEGLMPKKDIKYLSKNHADKVKYMYPEFYEENYNK